MLNSAQAWQCGKERVRESRAERELQQSVLWALARICRVKATASANDRQKMTVAFMAAKSV